MANEDELGGNIDKALPPRGSMEAWRVLFRYIRRLAVLFVVCSVLVVMVVVLIVKLDIRLPSFPTIAPKVIKDLNHCEGLFEGIADLNLKVGRWFNRNGYLPQSIDGRKTTAWFNHVSSGISRAEMQFRVSNTQGALFFGTATANIKNSDCSVISFKVHVDR